MFAHIDPKVRAWLLEQGKLIRIDGRGNRLANTATAADTPEETQNVALNILGPIPLPVRLDDRELDVQWYAVVRSTELAKVDELAQALREQGGQRLFSILASYMAVNSVLMIGDPANSPSPLVRVHSSCLSGDVFGSQRCECGPQFKSALNRIADDPSGGMLIYMSGHEGRGIGLWAKAVTYLLQDSGEDTYQANRSLGLPDDSRDFSDAGAMLLHFLGDRPFRLLTNNPKKIADLGDLGLTNITPEKHVVGVSDWNRRYLAAKRDWGHKLALSDLGLE
ncbi:MAG: GTP cyclohydrolase II [Gammaproteobacteria bacterium]|jgi:GTP cyclohydrolase II